MVAPSHVEQQRTPSYRTKPLSRGCCCIHRKWSISINRVDGQKRSNQWRVVVTTRYEGGIQGFRLSKANETDLYRPVHLYSRHFWPYLAFSRSFLNEGRSFFFFPFPPLLGGRSLSYSALRLRLAALGISVFHSITSSHPSLFLSRPFYLFIPSLCLLLRTDASVHTFTPYGLYGPCVRREKRRKTSTGWKVLPLIHG